MTREANSKAEQSITPDQQKKLQDKVDKCKQDVQKVQVTSLKLLYMHFFCLDTFTLLMSTECGLRAAHTIRKYVCILLQVHTVYILFKISSLTLTYPYTKCPSPHYCTGTLTNIVWMYTEILIIYFAIYSCLSWCTFTRTCLRIFMPSHICSLLTLALCNQISFTHTSSPNTCIPFLGQIVEF